MNLHLSFILWMPLVFGVLCLQGRNTRVLAMAGTVIVLGYVIAVLIDFDSAAPGLQYVTDETWIGELGISYKLGVDGLNLLLIVVGMVVLAFYFLMNA